MQFSKSPLDIVRDLYENFHKVVSYDNRYPYALGNILTIICIDNLSPNFRRLFGFGNLHNSPYLGVEAVNITDKYTQPNIALICFL